MPNPHGDGSQNLQPKVVKVEKVKGTNVIVREVLADDRQGRRLSVGEDTRAITI